MARRGYPWRRKQDRSWWYTNKDRKKIRLGGADLTEEQAVQAWHMHRSRELVPVLQGHSNLAAIVELFLERPERFHPKTLDHYRRALYDFVAFIRNTPVDTIRAKQVDAWLDSHRTADGSQKNDFQWTASGLARLPAGRPIRHWSEGTCSAAMIALQSCLNWAAAPHQRYIEANPIAGMPRPQCPSRGAETLIPPDVSSKLYQLVTPALADVLLILSETGTRPINVTRIERRHCFFQEGTIRLETHKTAWKTGKPLVIRMTPAVKALLERLAIRHPEGPLFRTSRGQPWTSNNISVMVAWYAKKLGLAKRPTPGGYRHTVATNLLEAEVDDYIVAEILGHANTTMIYHHYGHLDALTKRLDEGLAKNPSGLGNVPRNAAQQ